jgi:outer membrane protein assembly factor BamD (BamD/ComL family)
MHRKRRRRKCTLAFDAVCVGRFVWRCALVALLGVGAWPAREASAQGLEELRAAAAAVAQDIEARKKSGDLDAAAQRAAVERLSRPALGFVELSDRDALAGRRGGDKARRAAYKTISAPLVDIYERNNAAIERSVQKIIDADGDLEALYETSAFQESQSVAAHALYLLNWLHFYASRLYDGEKRRALLEDARRGFSEFAVGDRGSDLLTESLLGRGLCHLELERLEYAIRDLQAVAEDPQAAAERRGKARLALLDAQVRAGNTRPALQLADRLLQQKGPHHNWVRFLRVRALLDAARRASGAQAAQYRRRALKDMERLRRAGGAWEERVTALLRSEMAEPVDWAGKVETPFAKWELARLLVAKGDYDQAAPLLEEVLASDDASLQAHRGEAHYMLGLARFRSGEYEPSAVHLEAALEQEEAPYAADAAYMRFKALEALVAENWDANFGPRYETAVREFLDQHGGHQAAYEARFRLAELLQAQARFDEAIAEYSKVAGDPGIRLQAEFGSLQCHFELLRGDTLGDNRDARVERIGEALQRFDAGARELQKSGEVADEVPLEQMQAKAAIMRAVYRKLLPDPDNEKVLDALAEFETRYPGQQDLLPQVVRMRLTAYRERRSFVKAPVVPRPKAQTPTVRRSRWRSACTSRSRRARPATLERH